MHAACWHVVWMCVFVCVWALRVCVRHLVMSTHARVSVRACTWPHASFARTEDSWRVCAFWSGIVDASTNTECWACVYVGQTAVGYLTSKMSACSCLRVLCQCVRAPYARVSVRAYTCLHLSSLSADANGSMKCMALSLECVARALGSICVFG